ncbi:MAG: DUF3025 domain-containing protein [Burkholderiaceae bacterium]
MVAGAVERSDAGAVDWAGPWFDAVAAHGRAVSSKADVRAALTAAAERLGVRNAAGQPIRFATATAAGDSAYEAHIGGTGEVPTRDNRHDFFNALVWLAFPRTKARLNALQSQAIASTGVLAQRGPLRDAATLIDENAVLLVTERADIVDALRRHDWRALFVEHRAAWVAEVRPVVFGHALMEKLAAPYKGITAHALPVRLGADASVADIDARAAEALDSTLTPRQLLPLPVLGIPGWADNDDLAYYEDAAVFRPKSHRRGLDDQSLRGRR